MKDEVMVFCINQLSGELTCPGVPRLTHRHTHTHNISVLLSSLPSPFPPCLSFSTLILAVENDFNQCTVP